MPHFFISFLWKSLVFWFSIKMSFSYLGIIYCFRSSKTNFSVNCNYCNHKKKDLKAKEKKEVSQHPVNPGLEITCIFVYYYHTYTSLFFVQEWYLLFFVLNIFPKYFSLWFSLLSPHAPIDSQSNYLLNPH